MTPTRLILCLLLMLAGPAAFAEEPASPPRPLLEGEPTADDLRRALTSLQNWENTAPDKAQRLLHICYWTPADREPCPQYQQRLTRVMTHIQDFYAQELTAWGFADRTIRLDFDKDRSLKLHLVKGTLRSEQCSETEPKVGEDIRRDCLQALRADNIDGDKQTIVIFCNLADWDPDKRTMAHHSPYYASGTSRSGTAWQVDSPLLDPAHLGVKDQFITDRQYGRISLGKYNSIFIGGVCHELGHALGLPHSKESAAERATRGTALMGTGNHTYAQQLRGEGRGTFLTLADALKLAAHPQFSGSIKQIDVKADAHFTDWQFTADATGLRVRGRVSAKLPVYTVIGYADPEGNDDYDSEIAAGIVEADGAFSLHLPRPEKRNCAATLRFIAVCVNGAATAGSWPHDAPRLPCRIDGKSAYDATPAIEQCELTHNTDRYLKGELGSTEFEKLSPRVRQVLERLKRQDSSHNKPTPAVAAATLREAALSDLAPSTAKTGWGGVHFDRDPEGRPLQGPQGFLTDGLFAHADSTYEYALDAKWARLTGAACTLDRGFGAVEATIEGDGKTLWGPTPLKPGRQARFDIEVKGVKTLKLIIKAPTTNRGAWAAWATPRLTQQE